MPLINWAVAMKTSHIFQGGYVLTLVSKITDGCIKNLPALVPVSSVTTGTGRQTVWYCHGLIQRQCLLKLEQIPSMIKLLDGACGQAILCLCWGPNFAQKVLTLASSPESHSCGIQCWQWCGQNCVCDLVSCFSVLAHLGRAKSFSLLGWALGVSEIPIFSTFRA